MAKMTRNALKGIVKECLVEILSEGLDTSGAIALSESKKTARRKKAIRAEETRLAEHRQKFETRVEDTISTVTDDPIMQSILADTARTTLQEQSSHDSPAQKSGDAMMQSSGMGGAGINLDGIFNSSSTNWENLAFTKSESD